MLPQAEQQLGTAVRAFNSNELSLVQLIKDMRTAHDFGLTTVNSAVYKSAERLVASTKKTKQVAREDFGSTKQKQVTFKVWDIGGQEVCFPAHVIMHTSTLC